MNQATYQIKGEIKIAKKQPTGWFVGVRLVEARKTSPNTLQHPKIKQIDYDIGASDSLVIVLPATRPEPVVGEYLKAQGRIMQNNKGQFILLADKV